jgi:hypothetical protein
MGAVGSSATWMPTKMRPAPASTPAKLRSKTKLPPELTPAPTAIIVRARPAAVAVLPRVAIGGVAGRVVSPHPSVDKRGARSRAQQNY